MDFNNLPHQMNPKLLMLTLDMMEQDFYLDEVSSKNTDYVVFSKGERDGIDEEIRLFNTEAVEQFDEEKVELIKAVNLRARTLNKRCRDLEDQGYKHLKIVSDIAKHVVLYNAEKKDFWMFGSECEHHNEPKELLKLIDDIENGRDVRVVRIEVDLGNN
jgi:hypothetical protein